MHTNHPSYTKPKEIDFIFFFSVPYEKKGIEILFLFIIEEIKKQQQQQKTNNHNLLFLFFFFLVNESLSCVILLIHNIVS